MLKTKEFSNASQFREYPGERPDAEAMIAALLEDHETLVCSLRNDLKTCEAKYRDVGTGNFLADILRKHEKTAWMLRAYLENGAAHKGNGKTAAGRGENKR